MDQCDWMDSMMVDVVEDEMHSVENGTMDCMLDCGGEEDEGGTMDV